MEESQSQSDPKIILNFKKLRKYQPAFKSKWKYENEPRVMFQVHVLRSPDHIYGAKILVGIPESIVGNARMERDWLKEELGGRSVRLKHWRPWILPELRRKRLLPKEPTLT